MGTIYNNIPGNAPTDNVYLNSLIIGGSWTPSVGTGANLTWSTSAGKIYQDINAYGSAWLLYETNALKAALQTWSNVANVQFNQISGIYNSDLRYFNVNAGEMLKLAGDSTTLGLHEEPDGSTQTSLYGMFNKQGTGWSISGLKQGGFGFLTLIHEIGHGLGLAHPHDGNTIFPGVTSGFGSLGDNNLNQGIWTVMSYNDGWIEVPTPTPVLSYGQAGTPMAFDIATIQYIYGANTTYKTGNDTYLLPTSNVSGTYWSCIWDAGGIDTISAATSRVSAEINLNAAPLIGPNAAGFVSHVGKTIDGTAIVGGFTIANSVVIENAIGGSADDILIGNQANNLLAGNAGNDALYGNDGNDTLDGGIGVDTMVGGTGNDTYIVDIIPTTTGTPPVPIVVTGSRLQDGVVELAGLTGGTDTLKLRGSVIIPATTAATNITLANELTGIENLDISATGTTRLNLTGNDDNNILTGNAANNTLTGGFGNDTLDGGLGADTLNGGDGDDTYFVDVIRPVTLAGGDIIIEDNTALNFGNDTVKTIFSADLKSTQFDGIENLSLLGTAALTATGDEGDNELIGNAAANILNGGIGSDTLFGGAGADTLNGGAGADSMNGGDGNDTYTVDDVGDTITETNAVLATGGTDLVKSSIGFDLNNNINIENLTLTGTDDDLFAYGNSLVNVITGNSGRNILYGYEGKDTLIGGAGNDGYQVDLKLTGTEGTSTASVTLEDIIIETTALSGGYDAIQLFGNYNLTKASTITLAAGLEALDAQFTGTTLINLVGNAADNGIQGNDADNNIDGGLGDDILIGKSGNDTLDGGIGVDILDGGSGNDTYLVDIIPIRTTLGHIVIRGAELQDSITESNGISDGIDTLKLRGRVTIPAITAATEIALTGALDSIENLDISLTGATRLNITGNAENNFLTGNAANNILTGGDGMDILIGGVGADTMIGGLGIDTYVVDNIADIVIEHTDEGDLDMINSFISFDLSKKGANIEYLNLAGTAAIHGTGNDLNNGIYGNTATNILEGGAGDDLLDGGSGNDTIDGGADNDSLTGGSGNDILTGGIGADSFVWELADKGANGRPANDKITDFNSIEDKLDLRDLLVGESNGNILNFLDVTTSIARGVTNTEIRISNTGGFASGNFATTAENQHITLAGVNLFIDTGTSTEANLLATLIAQNKLIIDV